MIRTKKVETELGTGLCQVRSGTDQPCARPAVEEILGVPFCEHCAREQEAYFAIGELTQAQKLVAEGERGPLNFAAEPLVETLGRMQQQFIGRVSATRKSLGAAKRKARGAGHAA
ncbi:MAG: hypothetical protein ACR2JR_13125 [Rubrobacteraceae bacterium]